MKKLIPLVVSALLLASCLPNNMRIPQSPLLSKLERKAGLIAYMGADGNMYVSDQGGGHKTKYTDNGSVPESQTAPFTYYEYPTWSADSTHLAFVGVAGENGSASETALYIADIKETKARKVFSNPGENPFYLYWSPDDKTLTYLSSTVSGQSVMLQSVPTDGGKATVIDTGNPYYWSWSPDGSAMIVHSGSETSSVPAHLSFLQTGSDIVEDQLDTIPASFQAPAWSPNGEHILLSRVNDKKENEIIVTDRHGKFEKAIGTYELSTAFAWSYDSELVAYIDGTTAMGSGTLGKLHVFDITNSEDFFQDDNVIAAFWSPNSKKLAYFKPLLLDPNTGDTATSSTTNPVLVLELHVLDVNSAQSKQVLKFQPTNQFAAILPYFDQYHQSATIWSPDNNNLVIPLFASDGNPSIAIVAASGQLDPRVLDKGYIAFWSWK
jgi:Tol biopolymer transport system component